MEAKYKAKELVDKYLEMIPETLIRSDKEALELAKLGAIACVNEILYNHPFRDYGFKFHSIPSRLDECAKYWYEVKVIINKY